MDFKGVDYSNYQGACKFLCSNDDYFMQFKSAGFYRAILEHLEFDDGVLILNEIRKYFQLSDNEIQNFCKVNDRIGNTVKYVFSDTINCSPTSLRYILHAHLILIYLNKLELSTVRIAEVGGGYGGLFLALVFFAEKFGIKIQEYHIVDLEEAGLIQNKYLSYFPLNLPYTIWNANTFGKDIPGNDLFFISNYCFSEISLQNAKNYIEYLLPKCPHGFLMWNMRPLFDFGKNITIETPIPNISEEYSHIVYF